MPRVSEIAKSDPVHCFIVALLGVGFFVSMCGLAAIPIGDVTFNLAPTNAHLNITYPTAHHKWKGEQIIVEFQNGEAIFEYTKNKNHTLEKRSVTREWGQYIPGLQLTLGNQNYYQPIHEWKVIPEETPLMWVAPIWAFITGVLTLAASYAKRRDMLLNALFLAGVSASLLMIASHRVVELTQFCGDCDSMTKHISSDGHSLGPLPDGAADPDLFADNNCPELLHKKCEGGRGVYLAGGVINLICMYLLFITVEVRRHYLQKPNSMAAQDEMADKKW